MRYQNAAELLPAELLEALQGYLDGGYLYIPRRAEHRRAWGERTRRKEETLARNRAIFRDYTAGLGVDELSARYFLAPKSIQRILTVCSETCPQHALLIRNLVSVLARKNLQLNDKITHMSKRRTREKLLSYLSSESLRQGSLEFDIPFDRQQLADYLCIERSAMSAELSRLQKEGLLQTERCHFRLIAPLPGALSR